MSKATTAAAIIFMITSLALTILIARPGVNSVIDEKRFPKQRRRADLRRRSLQQVSLRSRISFQSRSGGIGRRTILRWWRLKAWGFESPLRHLNITTNGRPIL